MKIKLKSTLTKISRFFIVISLILTAIGTNLLVFTETVFAAAPTVTVTSEVVPDTYTTKCEQTGNITATGGKTVTTRGFQYDSDAPGAPYAFSSSTSGSYSTGSYTISLTGLTPDTLYYVRAYATNADGTGYSAETTFYTPPTNCYWVGAGGLWSDDDNHWATSSGGVPADGNKPGLDSNVIFDANSGFVVGNKTMDLASSSAYAHDMNWTGAPNNPIIASNGASLFLTGSCTLIAGMTNSGNGLTLTMLPTGIETLTSAGMNYLNTELFIGSTTWTTYTGSVTLQDDLTISGEFEVRVGSFDTDDNNLTASELTSDVTTYLRAIDLGSSTVTLSTSYDDHGVSILNTNLTWNAGTSTIILTGAGSDIVTDGATFYEVQLNGSGDQEIYNSNTFTNLTRTGTAVKTDLLTLRGNQTITGVLTLNGNSATNRILVQSSTPATYRTLTAATVSGSNVDFLDIQGAGAASWDLSAITGGSGNVGHNAGITFTTAADCYWVDNTGSWSDITHWASTSGGVAGTVRVPLVQDIAIFDANSITIGSRVINMDMPRIGNINFEDVLNTPQFDGDGAGGGSIVLYGDVILGNVTWTPDTTYLDGRGTQNITSNGATFDCNIYSRNYGAVVQLEDDTVLTNTKTWYLRAGTLNLNKQYLTLGYFNSSTTTDIRSLAWGDAIAGGTIEVQGTTDCWYMATTNFTMGSNLGTLRIHGDNATARNVYMAGITTYNNVVVEGSGAYTLTLTSAGFTCNVFYVNRSEAAKTISGNYTITANNAIYMPVNGVTTITIANTDWSTLAGNIISVDYIAFSGGANTSTASATGTWYAGTHSTGSPQTNWQFVGTTAPIFTTDAASDITETDAILHATITSLGSWTNGVYISFDYGMTTAYSDGPTAETTAVLSVPTTINIPISSLNPEVDYHFRAIARYNYLDYSYGADRTFYSDESVPEPVPGAPLASGLSSLSGADLPSVDILDQTTEEDMYALTPAASLSGLFGYPIIHSAAVAMTAGSVGSGYDTAAVEMQLWYIATGFILLLIVMGLLILIPGHQMISGLGGVAFLGLAISVHIYPWWVVFIGVLYLTATIVAERSSVSG